MGLVLDLAVIAVAVVVTASLAALAWTIAVSSARSVRAERRRVVDARRAVSSAEGRLRAMTRHTSQAGDDGDE